MLIISVSNYVLLFAELNTHRIRNAVRIVLETSLSDHCNSEVNTALCANMGVDRVATIIDRNTQRLCAMKDFLMDTFVQGYGRVGEANLNLTKLHANHNLQ